jgi:hypothetical protein
VVERKVSEDGMNGMRAERADGGIEMKGNGGWELGTQLQGGSKEVW